MDAFLAIIKKELGGVLRDRTIVIAILIQLFIASFSSALLLGVLSVYDPDTILQYGRGGVNIGMVDSTGSPLGSFLSARGLHIRTYATLAQAEAAFYQGEVNAILTVPPNVSNKAEIKLYLADRADAVNTLIRMVIQEPLKQYENYLRSQNGIQVHYTDLTGKSATPYELIYSIILPVLMFFPAFVAGSMVIDSLTEEVENNTLQTLLAAPLTINQMIAAKITATTILAIIQCAAWLVLLQWNGIDVQNRGWILILAVTVSGIAASAAALGAVIFKDRERSQFVYSLMLLTAAALSILLGISPINTLSWLAIGDYYTGGWNVVMFFIPLCALGLLLLKISRRLTATP
jgi:ABC-type Na+ efflux pump permease subunit